MNSKIILVSDVSDLEVIPKKILEDDTAKIYSFELQTHEILKIKKIEHEIADSLLNHDERLQLFNNVLKFRTWYSHVNSSDLEFEGVNLLKLSDTHEFHSYLMPMLVNLVLIKKIIEKERPTKIIATNQFEKLVDSVTKNYKIETEFFENKVKKKFLWDTIAIKYNIGKIPISFNLSKNHYLKLKKSAESISGLFYNFWLTDNLKEKSIVLLEFNPENFSNLLTQMQDYDGNVILVNQRRSAVWSKKALDIVSKSKCKVVNFDNFLEKDKQQRIPEIADEYSKKIEKFWQNTEFFEGLFQIEDCSFWNAIKDDMKKNYQKKLPYFIQLIWNVKKLFENQDVRCIVSLNDIGETEKAFHESNKNNIPSLVLQHGFIERSIETKNFDNLDYVHFKDKLSVWGKYRKEWLSTEFNIEPNRIIVSGSPRHDDYFASRTKKGTKHQKTVLLALNPISDVSGLSSTELKIRTNKVIKKIFSTIKKFNDLKIIVKLHAIQLEHNEEIKSLIKELDNTVPVYISTSIIDTINSADVVVVVSPENSATSTMLLESMILGKPTMNIFCNEQIYKFNHIQRNAVFTINDQSDIEKDLEKMLFNKEFQKDLTRNADNFIKEFMHNPGCASEDFSKILKSY